jgi:peptidoglycan/xylan/chitin deacetylase (PgdA/CDA1 family)
MLRVNGTFFVTHVMERVFDNLTITLRDLGHEVASHGLWHEDLRSRSFDDQCEHLHSVFSAHDQTARGANFIGRMNEATIDAFIECSIRYFVYMETNFYRLTSYPKRRTCPTIVHRPGGRILAIPVSVETYGLPWFSIRNMLDTALLQSARMAFPHITVLCHPFRDGSVNNIGTTERLTVYLLGKGLRPLTLSQLADVVDERGSHLPSTTDLRRFLRTKRPALAWPTTTWDYMGFLPQTAISIMKRVSKSSVFC